MPATASVRIKRPDERRWQGKTMPSIDLVPMTTGTAVYGADVTLPGMKVAAISRPPVWGGKVVSVDDAEARKVPGVERIVRIPETPIPGAFFPLGGVAVIAKNTWAALRGRDATGQGAYIYFSMFSSRLLSLRHFHLYCCILKNHFFYLDYYDHNNQITRV